ncbi:carboxylating nicotinate-nucleotide diphosphorylase [Paenalcaligenes niemegkensis]|uniref:carboxylating nicotinate-nucleotide diphosphorylase n=1 Tax=Paenalcaligenes niemegkensis TaxID=2895469 RepID=UPI001EE96558|nr:carboxylating nicotinate-nucleotide diphosphorylase [Paenalcaligenes niemegkensis]MCQ9616023.1 carboxylating nicotinate-nucleotide diphosphorylase [Paenalcaligenes niemegkensis]
MHGVLTQLAVPPLPLALLEPLVRAALLEDLGRAGDITSDAVVPAAARTTTRLVAREPGVLAGLDLARLAFRLMSEDLNIEANLKDGDVLEAGSVIAVVRGPARAMLSAERTALNFLGHLSGVASATASISRLIAPYGTKVTCTRKTMPGLRAVQKYAVRVGGGSNHRFGLDDAVLIKDNHVAIAGGIAQAVERARAHIGHLVKIELEVDTLEQLDEALALGVEVILLDNMSTELLREAVRRIDGKAISEASGGITPETVVSVAKTGVNRIAIGWLTHSAKVLDIGLDTLDTWTTT